MLTRRSAVLLAVLALALAPWPARAADPPYRFLGTKKSGTAGTITDSVIYFALAWDGAMKKDVCQRMFDRALAAAKKGKFYYQAGLDTTSKKPRGRSSDVFLFGYHSLTTKKQGWVAVFPGLKLSSGAYGPMELVPSVGDRFRASKEHRQVWPIRNRQAVIATFRSDGAGGLTFRLIHADPNVTIR